MSINNFSEFLIKTRTTKDQYRRDLMYLCLIVLDLLEHLKDIEGDTIYSADIEKTLVVKLNKFSEID